MVGNVLIEYQGIQHYEPVDFGGDYLSTFVDVKRHDAIKRNWCVLNGYNLLEILYTAFNNIQDTLERTVYHP